MTIREHFTSLLQKHSSGLAPLEPAQIDSLLEHYELLVRWNKVMNLTSIGNLEEVVVRHYCESLYLAHLVPSEGISVLDVGSGGGFPGIPMAIVCPSVSFTLAESHRRKAVFLRESTRGLGNVRIHAGRAEEAGAHFDWVVSRAVRPQEVVNIALKVGTSVGLLMGEADVERVRRIGDVVWSEPVRLPWGDRRVAMLGAVVHG